MTDYFDLEDGEVVVDPTSEEVLYRQIPAHLWDAAAQRPSADAFGPKSADSGMPSFSRSSIVTAQKARDWHNENAKSRSESVWQCSAHDVDDAGTRAVDDSAATPPPGTLRAPGHVFVDYRHTAKPQEREIRTLLFLAAMTRGEVPTEP